MHSADFRPHVCIVFGHQKRRFSKPVPREEFLEKAGLNFFCVEGRKKRFSNTTMSNIIQPMPQTGCDRDDAKNNLPFPKYPDTCGRGLCCKLLLWSHNDDKGNSWTNQKSWLWVIFRPVIARELWSMRVWAMKMTRHNFLSLPCVRFSQKLRLKWTVKAFNVS